MKQVFISVALAVLVAAAADDALQVQYRRHHRRHQPSPPSPPRAPPTPPPTTNMNNNPLCNSTLSPEEESLGSRAECPRTPPLPRPLEPPCSCRTRALPTECAMPLAGLMACVPFITGTQDQTPTPQSQCCAGLGAFFNSSSTLRCLCPVILGDVSKMLPKPVDPIRQMYLPIACGVVLPPQALYTCLTGHPAPAVVENFSQLWEDKSSSPAALSSP
ncbi:uncharacterized protein LOC120700504 [Panicum virgatum]|uniref:Bifunctional inhibitor/plant lipid transfer protein/seed storage helical domain-containing protein n=1 Tax=Panicum virgatum TaxID=38727 RepID=A0A8T0UJJ4_PANVG|nr:uncharacterized protein LOC120700504 [Panicum virgatum]KAG2622660.1 hypothetical protein PVAP13_3KG058388 [Panicum virgatum]